MTEQTADRTQKAIDIYRESEAAADAAVARGMRRGAARDIYTRYTATAMYRALTEDMDAENDTTTTKGSTS